MPYTFDRIIALDDTTGARAAQGAEVVIFAPGDGTQAPLALTDLTGLPLGNPLAVGSHNFLPDFMQADLDRVAWAAGELTGFITAYEGIKNEAVSARVAADASKQAAIDASLLVEPPAGGFRSVPLAVTLPASSSTTETVSAASLRFPLRHGAPVTRWRVHVRNYNYRGATAYAGAVSFTGLWFGKGSHATGAFAAAPVKVHDAFTTPANGDVYTSRWISTPIDAHTDYLLSTGFTNAADQANTLSVGSVWRTTDPANASVASPAQTKGTNAPFNFWIEAETSAATPVIAEVGSSGAAGVGSTHPILESPLAIHARKVGALPVHYAQSGTTLAVWNDAAHPKWQQWADLTKPDAVILTLGSNDAYGADALETIQANYGKVAAIAADRLSPNLYTGTIPPRTNTTDETKRRQMNDWLRTLPHGVRDLFEFSDAVSTDDETIIADYDADGLHTNTAGSTAKANAITRAVADPVQRYTIDQTAGRTVKVWDYLNNRQQIVYGDTGWRALAATDAGSGEIHVRRNGNLVTIRLNGVLLEAGSSATYFATLPAGFRCTSAEHYMIGSAGGHMDWQRIGIYGASGSKVAWLRTIDGSATRPSGALTGESTFTTTNPWPTTLPGTAVGTIPNA